MLDVAEVVPDVIEAELVLSRLGKKKILASCLERFVL